MTRIRRTHTLVRGLDDLLRLTGCGDLEDLTRLIDSRVHTVTSPPLPPVLVQVTDQDGEVLVRVHTRGIAEEPPFTLKTFWDTVDELATIADEQITGPADGRRHTPQHPSAFIRELAEFFETTPEQVLEHLGGGWEPVDDHEIRGAHEPGLDWYAAGDPLQGLLAIGRRSAFVAVPSPIPAGLAGPGRLEGTNIVPVPLGTSDTLTELGQAIDSAITHSRRNMDHCHGCRTYRHIFGPNPGHQPYCRDCMSHYFGLIID